MTRGMVPKIALVLGTTYTGKTWAGGWLAAHIRRSFVVIVHTHRDTSYLQHIGRRVRFVAVRSPRTHISAAYLRQTRRRYRYLYLSVYDLSPEETKLFLSSLIVAVKEEGNLALFIDEAHLFLSRYQVPREVVGFIRGARFYGVDVILISHRLKDIDVGIRCVLTHLILFRTSERVDLDILARELDLGSAADRVRLLPDRKHLFVNRRTGFIGRQTQI